MADEKIVTLENLGGGAASELFQHELGRVIQNILDPNSPAKAKRTITLKVSITPDDKRELGDVRITCEAKIPSGSGASTHVYFGRSLGRGVAVENDPKQSSLFDQGPPGPRAVAETTEKGSA